MSLVSRTSARRGDTLIEVMFAVGFFALVAIISMSVMNSGVNNAERDLELVTARNELNAQAEALRFVHSSYISEKTLPEGNQQYKALWEKIVSNAVDSAEAESVGLLNLSEIGTCANVYAPTANGRSPLQRVNAFVLNTRKLTGNTINSYIGISDHSSIFHPTELSSRILFSNGSDTSDDRLTDGSADDGGTYRMFDQVLEVEGIWAFAVTDGSTSPKYYDFYIQTCWYGPRATAPTFLDTVIRLYNPENV